MTACDLKKLKSAKISDYTVDSLVDIADFNPDLKKSTADRVQEFLNSVSNPYIFKVGGSPVRVKFLPKECGCSIQDSMLKIIEAQLL